MKKYYVNYSINSDNTFSVIEQNLHETQISEKEVFRGSISDCAAWINLKESGKFLNAFM